MKSVDSPSFVALTFLGGMEYRNSNFNRFIRNDLATSYKHQRIRDFLTMRYINSLLLYFYFIINLW